MYVSGTILFAIFFYRTAIKENTKVQKIRTHIDKKLTILIAEDNRDNFKLFDSILHNDYNIIHAWNGEEAIKLFREKSPQIILMDINMPIMNGYEAIAEIRKTSEIPIIAVTAYAYSSDEAKIANSGFNAYTSKPINAEKLRDQINDLTNKYIVII